jgi:hypothetical protein
MFECRGIHSEIGFFQMKNEEIRLQREKQNRKIEKYMCAT